MNDLIQYVVHITIWKIVHTISLKRFSQISWYAFKSHEYTLETWFIIGMELTKPIVYMMFYFKHVHIEQFSLLGLITLLVLAGGGAVMCINK